MRPTLGEETLPSVAGADQDHAESLVENPGQQGSTIAVDGDILQEETKTVENELTKEVPENHASDAKDDKEIGDGGVLLDGEALGLEQASSLGHVSEVNCNTTDDTIIDSPSRNKTTIEDASTLEASCGAEMGHQEGVNFPPSEKLDSDERLDGKYSSEGVEVETTVIEEDTQDHLQSPVRDISDTQSLPLEDGICPTIDQFMEENQPNEAGIAKMDETVTPINHVDEESKLDSCTIEADMSSQNTILNEGENREYSETDPKNFMESTPICTDYVDGQGHAEFGTDVFEHDTDFLNVDDDEVAEDYEGDDVPSTEEGILDNSGWSSRTRAVANYLQVLFEKEDQHGKKEISLENLLTGKSRKEASRMFFETLVLKTKDYIHAEQGNSFCDIRIKPRGKLLKSEF